MSFSKLDSGITKSSLWSESLHVRVVFLSFIAEKDENGFVSGSRSGMIRVCNVTPEQFDNAIEILSSPDPDSKSPDFDGRRISKCDGGWVVLNSDKYKLPEDVKRSNRNEYMKNYMREKRSVNSVNVNNKLTPINYGLTSVSISVSDSESVSDSLEELRENFIKEVNSHTDYSAEMLKDFFEYWSESDPSTGKMKFQLQDVWETEKRLERWLKKSCESNNKSVKSSMTW